MSEKINNDNSILNNEEKRSVIDTFSAVVSSIGRTTVRFFKNIPNKFKSHFKKRINEYKRRPVRKDINKVYVLVGYTTKKNIDAKYNVERNMIILRRGLLLLIFVLLMFISINKILPYINTNQYGQMFGIGSVKDMTQNDPFANPTITNEEDEIDASEEQISVTPTPIQIIIGGN